MPLLRCLSLLLAFVLFAAACGGGDDDVAVESDPEATSDASSDPDPADASSAGDTGDADTADTDADQADADADEADADGADAGEPESNSADADTDADEADADAVVGTFGGDSVTAAEIEELGGSIGRDPAGALSSWLLGVAIEQELADRGRPLTETDLEESEVFLVGTGVEPSPVFVRLNAVFSVARAFAAEEVAPLVDEAEPEEVLCSSHILLDTEAEAIDVAALAQSGEDFAELAMTYSTGPSGPNGGDLGCTATATFVPEFSDGARANGVGITDPVESQFGWHVIQVRSIGPGTAEIHPELTEAEVELFRQGSVDQLVGPYLDDLIRAASAIVASDAEFDPSYGVWDEASALLVG